MEIQAHMPRGPWLIFPACRGSHHVRAPAPAPLGSQIQTPLVSLVRATRLGGFKAGAALHRPQESQHPSAGGESGTLLLEGWKSLRMEKCPVWGQVEPSHGRILTHEGLGRAQGCGGISLLGHHPPGCRARTSPPEAGTGSAPWVFASLFSPLRSVGGLINSQISLGYRSWGWKHLGRSGFCKSRLAIYTQLRGRRHRGSQRSGRKPLAGGADPPL